MSSWRECKLGDVAKISKKSWKVGDEQMPYIGLEHIEEAKLRLNGIGKSDDVASNKFRFQAGDTLFGKLRPYFRKVVKPDFDGICSTDIWVINPQKGIDKDFIFYFFANKELVDISYSASGGTRMPRADWDFLAQTIWNIPPLEEQKAIAEVLSSLDDKIDLLHRQNQTLESLAQTLFRQWFIEEGNEEWEEVTLSDVMELKYGKDHKHLNDGKIPIYGSGGIMRYGDTAIYENESILIPRKGTLSNIFYVDEPFWTVDTIFWSKINSEKISGKLLFEFLKTLNFSNMNVGSAVPSLTTKVLNEISFALPSLEEQEEFKQYTDNAWDKVKQNKKQIQTLENLRDTLLPKLLSGEVSVKL
jgi:type I restriction enzyme S subunit